MITGVTRETADEAFAIYAKADASINEISHFQFISSYYNYFVQ